jgi:DNA repair protein RecN (Recombination protein N)
MLEEITVRDFALIDRIQVGFSAGLNLLTGETGAGKSIIVGALGAVLGEKLDASSIRSGCEETIVSAVVSVKRGTPSAAWLAERDIPVEDGSIVLRRVIRSNGRSSVYIQNMPVSRADLRGFTDLIVDLHGQHEHQSLLQKENQRKTLDEFACIGERVREFTISFIALSEMKKRSAEMDLSDKERSARIDLLEFAVAEIDGAGLKPGEDVDLEAEEKKLAQFEKLYAAIGQAADCLGGNLGAEPPLRRAKQNLDGAAAIDGALLELAGRLNDAFFEIDDIAAAVRSYRDGISFDPARLERIGERLAEIFRLKKKYGNSVAEIASRREESAAELARLRGWKENREELERSIAEAEGKLYEGASRISEKRKEAALRLAAAVREAIGYLGMPKADFQIRVDGGGIENGKRTCTAYGFDEVEYLISPNPGEPLKPLEQIASGGELSRIMLAIKTVLAGADTVETLVFDEVDTGIGGEVALEVAKFLSKLSKNKQVLCITHLASIAVRADNHLKVEKRAAGDRTVTSVRRIEGADREAEIARMLSGESEDETSLSHARELLKKYGNDRGRENGENHE